MRNECRSCHQDEGEENEQHGQEDIGACITIAVRKGDLGRRPDVQILTSDVVRARADIPVVDVILRRERLVVLSWCNLLGHEDAEKECRCKPGKRDEHDPGRCPIEPVVVPACPAHEGEQHEGESDGREADRHPAEPEGIRRFSEVEERPEIGQGGDHPAQEENVRPGDRPLPQLRPFILEIIGEKLRMGTGNVRQEDTGNQDPCSQRTG